MHVYPNNFATGWNRLETPVSELFGNKKTEISEFFFWKVLKNDDGNKAFVFLERNNNDPLTAGVSLKQCFS